MNHKPILIEDISLSFNKKLLFSEFTAKIFYRNRIAIIGNNGSGKTSLLKMLMNKIEPSSGIIKMSKDVKIGYVPQIILDQNTYSGGERFLKSFSKIIGQDINLLMLDEPTNHLDKENKKSLINMLSRFNETLIIVSHDEDLLKNCIDIIWKIDEGKIKNFSGGYQDFLSEEEIFKNKNVQSFLDLKRQRKHMISSLEFEQKGSPSKKHKKEKDRCLKAKRKETASSTKGGRAIGVEKTKNIRILILIYYFGVNKIINYDEIKRYP